MTVTGWVKLKVAELEDTVPLSDNTSGCDSIKVLLLEMELAGEALKVRVGLLLPSVPMFWTFVLLAMLAPNT